MFEIRNVFFKRVLAIVICLFFTILRPSENNKSIAKLNNYDKKYDILFDSSCGKNFLEVARLLGRDDSVELNDYAKRDIVDCWNDEFGEDQVSIVAQVCKAYPNKKNLISALMAKKTIDESRALYNFFNMIDPSNHTAGLRTIFLNAYANALISSKNNFQMFDLEEIESDPLFKEGKVIVPSSVSEKQILRGYNAWVSSIAFSSEDQFFATASFDCTIRVSQRNKKGMYDHMATLTGHTDYVTKIIFSPNSKIIASASYDKTIRLWHLDNNLKWTCFAVLKGHSEMVNDINFCQDSKKIVSCSGDKTVRVWGLDGKKGWPCIAILQNSRNGLMDGIYTVSFSPINENVIIAASFSDFYLWYQKNPGTWVCVLNRNCSGPKDNVVFSKDGKTIACKGGGYISLFRQNNKGEFVHVLNLPGYNSGGCIERLAVNSDGRTVAFAGGYGNLISLWKQTDQESWVRIETGVSHSSKVASLVFSPDDTMIASASFDHKVFLLRQKGECRWERIAVLSGYERPRMVGVGSVIFSHDGKMIAFAPSNDENSDNMTVRICDICFSQISPVDLLTEKISSEIDWKNICKNHFKSGGSFGIRQGMFKLNKSSGLIFNPFPG